MEILAENQHLQTWLLKYGSLALFFLLSMGIFIMIFPVPEETLLVLAGTLMNLGKLHFFMTIMAAIFGSIAGITMSYTLGRTAGHYLILRYGGWLGITQDHINKANEWFKHYGKWSLFFGYFIPGIRHITGLTAGTSELDLKSFALFAYSGAIFWVTIFLSLGYFFGDYWFSILSVVEIHIKGVVIACIFLFFIYLIVKSWPSSK